MIDHFRVIVHIFTKKNELLYTGILFVIISILLFFITIANKTNKLTNPIAN